MLILKWPQYTPPPCTVAMIETQGKANGQQRKMGRKLRRNAICHCKAADMREGEGALRFGVGELGGGGDGGGGVVHFWLSLFSCICFLRVRTG